MSTITEDELAAELVQLTAKTNRLRDYLASATDPSGAYAALIDDLDDLAAVTEAILGKLAGYGADVRRCVRALISGYSDAAVLTTEHTTAPNKPSA
jgi:hypothetical protein